MFKQDGPVGLQASLAIFEYWQENQLLIVLIKVTTAAAKVLIVQDLNVRHFM